MNICRNLMNFVLAAALALSSSALMVSCESLPGGRTEQATVIGGVAGAAAGALIAENRLVGALIGGLLGAGGGYLIGAHTDWFNGKSDDADTSTRRAVENAQRNPATAEQAKRARTADINNDGFVTLDEVVAMEDAGFSDGEIKRRLEATGHIFDLNEDQERYLRDEGVSRNVITAMREMNREERDRILARTDDDAVIGRRR